MSTNTEPFYLRYYTGHVGKFGHEFLEFELNNDGLLRYANNSSYRRDNMIRKQLCLSPTLVNQVKAIVDDSEILQEDDSKWPQSNEFGKQELELRYGNKHISFETAKIGSLVDIQNCEDPEGLKVFYYLVQDLKCLVFSLISLHFKIQREIQKIHQHTMAKQ